MHGLLELPVWGYVAVTLVMTHLTIVGVTVYLHRNQAHRALDLHPAVSHFLRFWLWLTTGMETKEWVAIHRKHHARVETPDDPHSPQIEGIRKVLLEVQLQIVIRFSQLTRRRFPLGDLAFQSVRRPVQRGSLLLNLSFQICFRPNPSQPSFLGPIDKRNLEAFYL